MRLIHGLKTFPLTPPCVATIGNFDGMHLGHQALLAELKNKAKSMSLPSVVILFEPQPLEFFNANACPARLMNFREKLKYLAKSGCDYVYCLRFNKSFSQMTARDFIERVLQKGLQLQHLIVGDDFRFGYKRQGDFALLQRYDFSVQSTATISKQGERISSSRVRTLLAESEFEAAAALLGRAFTFSGRVCQGAGRGAKDFDMPTANIQLKRRVLPVSGVFVVKVRGIANKPYRGVACVGHRPMIDEQQDLLEVHVLDYHGDLVGTRLEIEILNKIREQRSFESLAALKEQMHNDCRVAKE